jgi:hypothetical protein
MVLSWCVSIGRTPSAFRALQSCASLKLLIRRELGTVRDNAVSSRRSTVPNAALRF